MNNFELKLIVDINEIKKLSKKIKKNKLCFLFPKKINLNEYFYAFYDKFTNNIISFIWFGIYSNNIFDKYIHINYSYTITEYRSNGLNTLLRYEIEKMAKLKKINIIISIPFENANSNNILIKLGYEKKYFLSNYYYLKKVL